MFRAAPLPLLPVAMLVGCADPANYPTLAPRPIERVSFAEPAPPPAPPTTPAAAADGRFEPFTARVREGDAAFRRALEEAGPALTAGRDAAVGSDAWALAQQRLSRLQVLRDPVTVAIGDLRDAADRPDVQGDPGLAAAAARAITAASAIDAAEATALVKAAPARS